MVWALGFFGFFCMVEALVPSLWAFVFLEVFTCCLLAFNQAFLQGLLYVTGMAQYFGICGLFFADIFMEVDLL